MYSIKNLVASSKMEQLRQSVVGKKLKDPVTRSFLISIYVRNKGAFIWNSIQSEYCSIKDYSLLTTLDISDVIWDLSY